MRTRARVLGLGSALALALASSAAGAATLDRGTAEAVAEAAMTDGRYAFCASPSKPLSRSARRMCPLAGEIAACEGFARACEEAEAPAKPPSWWSEEIARTLGYLALGAVAIALVAAVVALVVALVRLMKRAKDEGAARDDLPVDVVGGDEPAVEAALTTDADRLLRAAREHVEAGRFDLALYAYLGASLRALDARGSIRVARHRTHGEYVRACAEAAARPGLREIVSDVDAVRFGGVSATEEAARRAAVRATAIVRGPSAAVPPALGLAVLALLLTGCNGNVLRRGADPAGDELLVDLLSREGATARHLPGPLAALPMKGTEGPAVIVDADVTRLDEETQAHVVAWVQQGGALVIAGDPDAWPRELWAKRAEGASRDVRVETPCPDDDDACAHPRVDRLRLASPAAMSWPHDGPLASRASLDTGELYGALRPFGSGVVLGLASGDLLTNAGLHVGGNAAGLVALLEGLDKAEFLIARPEHGVAPPANPFAGLARIGLGLGLWHGLAFAALLFLSVGVRLARPAPEPPPRRRAFAEHVRAAGALYARARATGHALHAYARFVDQDLRARAPRGTSPAVFLAHRGGVTPEDASALYARATGALADAPPSSDDLQVLRRLSVLFAKATRDR